MPSKTDRLGRGLDALIPTDVEEFMSEDAPEEVRHSTRSVIDVDASVIVPNPNQPRGEFSDDELRDLSESIKAYGIVQPLIVSKKGEGYQLIAGERRLRAAKLAGLKQVPVIVRSFSEQEGLEVALIENVQRADLKPLEKAAAYSKLVNEFNLKVYEIARRVGKAQPTVSNTMRLLSLDKGVKGALADGRLSEGQARAILGVGDDPLLQRQLLARVVNRTMTVREIEDLARTYKSNPDKPTAAAKAKKDQTTELTKDLGKRLRAKVFIKPTAKGGRLTIEYTSEDQLQKIYKQIIGE
ncbi:ParB/RepB/Spo0J family partition protein [Candidatus Saccharibacteria bacterium]|nr:ParB/RepB/Spo0J family partition protein [Candidatus Saccharibacteria bacterium]